MGQVNGRAWVGGNGFVAVGFVQIGDGSVEEERRDGKAVRRERLRKDNEGKNKK